MTTAEVMLQYQQRLGELQSALVVLHGKQVYAIAVILLALLCAVVCGVFAYSRNTLPVWSPPLALSPALVSIQNFGRRRWEVQRLRRLRRYYEQGASRLDGSWEGQGQGGQEFQRADHQYAFDLNLFGAGSLFERMCTARTHLGRERLARFLTEPAGRDEAQRRQEAVRELSGRCELREQITLLGKYDFKESKWQTFGDWLNAPSKNVAKWLRPSLLASSVVLLGLFVAMLMAPSFTPFLWKPALVISVLQGIAGALLLGWVREILAITGPVTGEVGVIREGLALLAEQSFSSAKLRDLASRSTSAAQAISELDPWLFIVRERTRDWLYPMSVWLALGTQSALAVDAWRGKYKEALIDWLDAWAEFDALNAVACYAHENPEDCWPEIRDGEAFFAASELGHPLMARADCVTNDVCLGADERFWLISGSNMAGKSTLLRSIGLASVLALAGAPVRAAGVRMAAMQLHASISIVDSLREGRSKFLAEVQRLRDMLDASLRQPVLFLIDEIFSGTNSRDRQLAAEAVVRTLVERGAIGAVSTHDIALASIAEHRGRNVHMASAGDDPLHFDYRIKPGVTPETNAIAIARMAGVPV